MITTLAYLTARAAQLPSSESSRLERVTAAGGDRFAVLFEYDATQELIWTIPLVPPSYQGGLTSLEIQCAMATDDTGDIALSVAVESDSTTAVATASFDTANSQIATVPGTIGQVFSVTVDLTNDDSLAAGKPVRFKLVRESTGDTTSGNLYVLSAVWSETVATVDLDASMICRSLTNNVIGLVVKGDVSQTANLQEWQDSNGNPLSFVDKSGNINLYPVSLANSSTIEIDFNGGGMRSLNISGDVTFTSANLGTGKSLTILIRADSGGGTNFTWPSWIFLGDTAPASIAASKTAMLNLVCFGNADTDVVACYAVEP